MHLLRQGGASLNYMCVVGSRGPFSCMFRNELFLLHRASDKLKNVLCPYQARCLECVIVTKCVRKVCYGCNNSSHLWRTAHRLVLVFYYFICIKSRSMSSSQLLISRQGLFKSLDNLKVLNGYMMPSQHPNGPHQVHHFFM